MTVVEPPPIGSKATPPAATVPGEADCPAAMVTVRDWPDPLVVTSCPTAVFVWLTVTVTLGAPTRSACEARQARQTHSGRRC